mgnify:CR=1 FL=1
MLKAGLGMDDLSKNTFQRIVEIAHLHVKSILDRMCDRAKKLMKSKEPGELGSWSVL